MTNFKLIAIGVVAVLGLVALNGAETAHAQVSGDGYKQAIRSAVVEFDAGNWAEARVLFEHAHSLRPSARTLRGLGMTSFEMKEYVRAETELNASLVDLRSPLAEVQRHEVLALLLRLERYIGKLIVHTRPEGAKPTITLDDSKFEGETKVDIGRHEVSVQAPGYRPLNRAVSIEGGKTQVLELTLTPFDLDARTTQAGVAAGADTVHGPGEATQGDAPIVPPMAMPNDDDRYPVRRSVFKQWWFWTIVGVVAVGGATAAIVVTSKSGTEPPLQGNTGAVVHALSWSR